MEAERLHLRLLLLLDELHRIGFEQLRFARNASGQAVRLQIYAARSNTTHDWMFEGQGPMICFSTGGTWANYDSVVPIETDWIDLLLGDRQPKHLAGLFVLDFSEVVRPAYGPDHEYRQWFRSLRTFLHQGYLPMTWADETYGGAAYASEHSMILEHPKGRINYLPRPPSNPFVRIS